MKYSLIIIIILCSCQNSDKINYDNISKEKVIKKEKIIRYKLLPHKNSLNSTFSTDKRTDDILYQSDSIQMPILKQFQGYKVIQTSSNGEIKIEYTYDINTIIKHIKIIFSSDSIVFSKELAPSTGDIYTKLTLTSNNIKKFRFDYYNTNFKPTCGWQDDRTWDYITYIDSNNNPITRTGIFGNEFFKYNSKGQLIEFEHFNPITNKKIYYGNSVYDNNDLLIEKKTYSTKPGFNLTTRYKYNNDTLVQTSRYDNYDNLLWSKSTKYEYDDKMNWIKKTESIDSVPRFITKRQIFYY